MSETTTTEAPSVVSEKPVQADDNESIKFPPFPDPIDADFEDDISKEEREYYKKKFPDLNAIKSTRLHCSACDRHLGCSARNEARMRVHPMLRTLMCHTCHSFYNSGEFDKGDDGSELYCRWCGQGGQVYCCSDCPIVFCAKCIKRNFGMPKIKEIENTDDWKCFKCNPNCLWDLRAVCWALLRYCDLKNKITYTTQDPELKEAYQKECALDESECCKNKSRRKEKESRKKSDAAVTRKSDLEATRKSDLEATRKSDLEATKKSDSDSSKKTANAIAKIPPSIQVKKFASIRLEDDSPKEKKAQKRPASPKVKPVLPKPAMSFIPNRMINPIAMPPYAKKIRMPNIPQMTTMRFQQKTFQPANTYTRIRPKPPQIQMPVMMNNFNHFNNSGMMNNVVNDNINLSLENLTQGLDMSSIARMAQTGPDSGVVCTPDFPLEPLCEVTEDNNDDDVECITPAPAVSTPVISNPPPLIPRFGSSIKDLSTDNIIQMTENDVTVNEATGGLKFRVDPQTLSSNKMYRLPDGRVFAINANPNMPGGYSATIVAVTESSANKVTPKGSTYAAKLSAVTTPQTPSPPPKTNRSHTKPRVLQKNSGSKRNHQRQSKATKIKDASPRHCDLKIPVEWFRYNVIDAVDALEYSLSRLQKLKKEATTVYLRSRTVEEMRTLHKSLDSLLKTSSTRFNEIRDNLTLEMKQFVAKKLSSGEISDDDDDVEILNDVQEDPIFIDENSMDSTNANETNGNINNEVDLTGPAGSEVNDSGEKSVEGFDKETLDNFDQTSNSVNVANSPSRSEENKDDNETINEDNNSNEVPENNTDQENKEIVEKSPEVLNNSKNLNAVNGEIEDKQEQIDDKQDENDTLGDTDTSKLDDDMSIKKDDMCKSSEKEPAEDEVKKEKTGKSQNIEMLDDTDKTQDTEMTEKLIDSLLKGDTGGDNIESTNLNCMEITDDFQEP